MKDILNKLSQLEATAPKKTSKKKVITESTSGIIKSASPLAQLFNELHEALTPGQKPMPVVGKQGDTQNTSTGFLNITDTSPTGQAMQKAMSDLAAQGKAQIVVPNQPGQQSTGTIKPGNVPAPAGSTGQPQQGQMQMKEAPKEDIPYDSPDMKKFREIQAYLDSQELKKATGRKSDEKQLDELSPKTLKSYANKADSDQVVTNRELKNRYHTGLDPDLMKQSSNRTKGMKLAGDKMMGRAKVPANEGAKVDRMVKHIEKSEKKAGKSKEEAQDIAWATANKRGMLDNKNKKKMNEADMPYSSGVDTRGAGLGAGRSQTTLETAYERDLDDNEARIVSGVYGVKSKQFRKKFANQAAQDRFFDHPDREGNYDIQYVQKLNEGAKPDFLDLDKDGNKKEPMKKAAADKKKQKVKESMNHRISAARLEGKTHGLRGHAHHGKSYEDLEEMRAYHEGYKEGLDECYGQGVYETAMPATVPGMASAAMPAMEDDMGEGNAFTGALARTPKGGKFSLGGKTFTDRSSIDEYAFESLDRQLNALLNESEEVSEGLSVSISKGQEHAPDSVTITAQDQEADQLLDLVKQAGLGLFGDDSHEQSPAAPSAEYGFGGSSEETAPSIEVVDDHDGMMGLMRKLSGISGPSDDSHEDSHDDEDYETEEPCNECGGMMEADHSCGSKEMVDEVETEDQMEYEVAEEADSGAEDSEIEEKSEADADAALADTDGEEEDQEDIEESYKDESLNEWANDAGKRGTEQSFEADIEFMTKMISGGLNKPKSTGQTTVPVIAGQNDRMHDHSGTVSDSVDDWKKLAGLK